jgi:hypothetical protein
MPCYTARNEHLEPGTSEHLKAEVGIKAKLESIRHIVDYYHEVNSFSVPSLQDGMAVDKLRQLNSTKDCQSVERSPSLRQRRHVNAL